MVEMNTTASASVQVSDGLKAGVMDAMKRVQEVSANTKTLVDEIPMDVWNAWDASHELALVADVDGAEIEDECEPKAA
tara:strand:+ start:993 stop:1226 length:234 start_codon:yes stop_codon:yes gene_type:complete